MSVAHRQLRGCITGQAPKSGCRRKGGEETFDLRQPDKTAFALFFLNRLAHLVACHGDFSRSFDPDPNLSVVVESAVSQEDYLLGCRRWHSDPDALLLIPRDEQHRKSLLLH